MTIEEINEQWKEYPEDYPWNVIITQKNYNAARSALLRVAELEDKNKRLAELCKSILLDFGVFADITVRPYRDHTIELEQITNQ